MRRHTVPLMALFLAACTGADLTSPFAEGVAPGATRASAVAKADAPSIVNVTLAGGQARVTWTSVPAGGYQVTSCGDVALPTIQIRAAAETTTTYTGLVAGTRYGAKVRAWHESSEPNNGKFSACATFVGAQWVAAVTVTPNAAALTAGQTQLLTAMLADGAGNPLTDRVVGWTSSNIAVATVATDGMVTAVAPGTATITATSEGKSGIAVVTVQAAGWQRLAAPGAVPANLTTSAYASSLDAVFAAEMPDYAVGSLWRFDLATSRWTRLTASNWPIGKYRKLIYDATRHRLQTYWDGLGQVYSIPETGGEWTPDGSAGNSDSYYEAYAFQNPVSGRLSVFAGYGFGTFQNTLWEWSGTSGWLAMSTNGPVPAPRFGSQANVVVDAAGARAFFTQRWLGATPGMADDLWVLDLQGYAFRNLIPSNEGSDARGGSGMAYEPTTRTLYRYGGMTLHGFVITDNFVSAKPDDAVVGWGAMPASDASPGVRYLPGLHYDVRRHRLILVSGLSGAGWESDVWAYPVR